MATSMSISRAPRSLSEIVSDLGINDARKPASKDAELRADSKSLRVKTGSAWFFKSATARTNERTQAHAALLDGLRESLKRSYPNARELELRTAVELATSHLGIPAPGVAVKVEHLRKLSTHAEQVSRIKQQCSLPLDVAQEVVRHFDEGRNGTEPARFSERNMTAVGNHLKAHPQESVEDALRFVTATGSPQRDKKTAASLVSGLQQQNPQAQPQAKPQPLPRAETPPSEEPVVIHQQELPAALMTHPALQDITPGRRWQLLNVAAQIVPDYLDPNRDGFAVIELAAKAMKVNPQLQAHWALAQYANPKETTRLTTFDLDTIGPAPKAVPKPPERQDFLVAMVRATPPGEDRR